MAELIQVNVDITSDVVCPWCWVGKRHLDIALDQVKKEYQVHIHWHPFVLNPWVPDHGMSFEEYATTKFGEDGLTRFISGQVPFFEKGKAVGLNFNYSKDTRVVPTKKAHILLDYAYKHGKQHQLHEKLFGAYFCDNLDISDNAVLSDLISSVGLNADEALSTFTDQKYIKEYEDGIREAQRKGISGVPYFEIYLNNAPHGIKHKFSGAQPVETFVAVFNRLKLSAKV